MSPGDHVPYFAFGSNLLSEQMEERCKSAVFLARAKLRGFRIDFAGWSTKWGGGVATITPHREREVVGALWSISAGDLAQLDRHEGHPNYYRRVCVEVEADDGIGLTTVWTYSLRRQLTGPSKAYLDVVVEGRKRLGFPDHDVVEALVRADKAETKRNIEISRRLDIEARERIRNFQDEEDWRRQRFLLRSVDKRADEVQQGLAQTSDSPRVHPWLPKPKKQPRVIVRPRRMP